MSCHRVANTGTYPTAYCYLHLSSNKHRSMWLNTSMRLLSLITLLIYPPSHELHMLIVWQYPKHKETLQRTRKSAIAEPPCNKEKKNDNKVIAVISLNKTVNNEGEWGMTRGNLPPAAFVGYWSETNKCAYCRHRNINIEHIGMNRNYLLHLTTAAYITVPNKAFSRIFIYHISLIIMGKPR